MPYACWTDYIEVFIFNLGLPFEDLFERGIFWRAKLHLKSIENFNLEHDSHVYVFNHLACILTMLKNYLPCSLLGRNLANTKLTADRWKERWGECIATCFQQVSFLLKQTHTHTPSKGGYHYLHLSKYLRETPSNASNGDIWTSNSFSYSRPLSTKQTSYLVEVTKTLACTPNEFHTTPSHMKAMTIQICTSLHFGSECHVFKFFIYRL